MADTFVLSTPVAPGASGAQASWTANLANVGWPGTPEYEGLVFSGNPSEDETYTLQVGTSTEVYTFKATPVATNDVQIGGSAAATQSNLATKIAAVQSDVVFASDYADPLILVALDVDDAIVQTDGTGGDITIRTTANWGETQESAAAVSFFHIRKTIQASHVTDGGVYVPMPAGYSVYLKSGLILDGGGGKGGDTLDPKTGFDGVFTSSFALPGEPEVIGVTVGTVTQFAANDVLVLWGFLAKD